MQTQVSSNELLRRGVMREPFRRPFWLRGDNPKPGAHVATRNVEEQPCRI